MSSKICLILILPALLLNSCSMVFRCYVRNRSDKTLVMDVFLLGGRKGGYAPDAGISTARRVVQFRGNFSRFFRDTTFIEWKDSMQYRVSIPARSTIDFSDVAGIFLNGYPGNGSLRVVVSSGGFRDTLMNGLGDFRFKKFNYTNAAVILPRAVKYYDFYE